MNDRHVRPTATLPEGRIGWPLDRNAIRRGMVNHTFGMVRRNRDGSRRPHQGWDFAAPVGTPCFAVTDGTVFGVRNAGAYGRQIVLRFFHDFDGDGSADTLFAFYAHLARVDVAQGDKVAKGEQLGLTGDSGNAAGMAAADQHLHFELRSRAWPGRGLDGRYSPLALFGQCPLREPIHRVPR
jgi:murein DD-endopeptidase MepM/ murein hydrolase activator NlpD